MTNKDHMDIGCCLCKKRRDLRKRIDMAACSAYEFTINTNEGYIRFLSSDIILTEQETVNSQTIHIVNGRTVHAEMSSAELFDKLSIDSLFIKCGTEFNINLRYVRSISRYEIFFENGQTAQIPLPPTVPHIKTLAAC